jgi:AICAR transformylase/IMP cyclohydrolase PurH
VAEALKLLPAQLREHSVDYNRVRGGFLAQERAARDRGEEWRVVTKRSPTDTELKDLQFA